MQLLRDDCPRCGQECKPDEVERRLHLRSCTDAKVHAAHAEDQANEAEVRAPPITTPTPNPTPNPNPNPSP